MSKKDDDNRNLVFAEAYRLSERRLESQFTSALAADGRAMGFAGLSVAAAAVLCGLATDAHAPIALIVGAVFLVIAAGLSAYSARPVDFYSPGAQFNDLGDDMEKNIDYSAVLKELGDFNDKHSLANDKLLAGNSRFLKTAIFCALLGLTISIVPQIPSVMHDAKIEHDAEIAPVEPVSVAPQE
ncbi:hypothetical protein HW561_09555 [Rhodobacteraceae bacterium B1Z28]|uniref:Uncharacterized protein n=1 Tax=Ruegeria haliotis TaxID=2747601 RepID=A0ABX2PR05_9RHOB|nr:hypothetical protein [Ruegeria haliotis]NVO56032.1 hypothetical protein [Ruegeria haliotis]